MKAKLLFLFMWAPSIVFCQLSEDFSDGDLSANPAWAFNSNEWLINSNMQLQSSHQVASSNFSISTMQTMATVVQWEFYVKLSFNPSSANYVDVFLISASTDLTSANNVGYFVRLGNTQDEISLYRKDAGGVVKIIDGVDGILNNSENSARIRISRNAQNIFLLERDISGTGSQYIAEGAVTDAQYQSSSYLGILVRQSTSSFFNKHFFDDLVISNYVPDTLPPQVVSVHAISENTIELKFNEAVAPASSLVTGNYVADQGAGNPQQIISADAQTMLLTFSQNFLIGVSYSLQVQNISDLSGNTMNSSTFQFEYYTASRNDVVISEIMADPGPPVGLPNSEYIELRNRSGKQINLQGWKLIISGDESGEFPSVFLQPDSFLLVVSSSNIAQFQPYGRTIGISSFSSLPNSGGIISLRSKEGRTIHSINYSEKWYANALKKEGGWSLEMIDADNPCGSNNWSASVNSSGGTPGKINSIHGSNADNSGPKLLRSYSTDSLHLAAVFDEPLDSLSASGISSYQLSGGLLIESAQPITPLFTEVKLKLAFPMEKKVIYQLKTSGIYDCVNNPVVNDEVKAGVFSAPGAGDVIINEILFNPGSNGFDYVELLNNGKEVINLSELYLGNRNTSGTASSLTKLANESIALFPGEHAVFSESIDGLSIQYHVKFPDKCFEISLPSYPDDTGNVLLLDAQGKSLDELNYSDKWHFPLLKDKEGVSLERIDPGDTMHTKHNWQSAASSSGFGTPGYQNSQFKQKEITLATLEIIPKIFSPDMDGQDDFLMLHYQVEETGYMMTSTVYDAGGRMVKLFVKNTLLGTKGSFRWDGLDESNKKLRPGCYIIYSEIFNLQGKKQGFKNVVVIAGSGE